MLKSWSIKNFKPIVDSGELQLAPVTVLAGRNSSGKSSLLQSILMIAQTLGSRLLDRPLLPNERLVQLGTFEDILSEYSGSKTLEVGFAIEFEEEDEVVFDEDGEAWADFGPHIQSAQITVTFDSGNKQGTDSAIEASKVCVEHVSVSTIPTRPILISPPPRKLTKIDLQLKKISEYELDNLTQDMSVERKRRLFHNMEQAYYMGTFADTVDKDAEIYLANLSHFLPNKLVRSVTNQEALAKQKKIDLLSLFKKNSEMTESDHHIYSNESISKKAQRSIETICQKKQIYCNFPRNTILDIISWVAAIDTAKIDESFLDEIADIIVYDTIMKEKAHRFSGIEEERDLSILLAVSRTTLFFTNRIRYLGPLRADPGTIQLQFAPTSELDNVGFKGEYAAVVYHTNKNASIEWYNPQTRQAENGKLRIALDAWAQYLKIAEHISTEEAGAIGITWQIIPKEGRKPRSLPELGVGISQILPILIMGLLSPANSLLIIEQPELHMHPQVQARLGDFFMGLAKCKKQCLIETHSENLVSQLRLHIVEAGGLEKSDCMVYFVDQDEKGAAKFERVKISERGNILNWPENFFDESMIQEDKITAASLRKRAKLAKHE